MLLLLMCVRSGCEVLWHVLDQKSSGLKTEPPPEFLSPGHHESKTQFSILPLKKHLVVHDWVQGQCVFLSFLNINTFFLQVSWDILEMCKDRYVVVFFCDLKIILLILAFNLIFSTFFFR